jgi:hypothetical protein
MVNYPFRRLLSFFWQTGFTLAVVKKLALSMAQDCDFTGQQCQSLDGCIHNIMKINNKINWHDLRLYVHTKNAFQRDKPL